MTTASQLAVYALWISAGVVALGFWDRPALAIEIVLCADHLLTRLKKRRAYRSAQNRKPNNAGS